MENSNVSDNVFSSSELAMRDACKKNSIKNGLVNLCSEEYYASINYVISFSSVLSNNFFYVLLDSTINLTA